MTGLRSKGPIPEATIERLALYRRSLAVFKARSVTTVGSEQLGEMARVAGATVRRDLSYLGSLGTRGSGYEVGKVLERIEKELGLDRLWPIVIVGVGNLGRALARSEGFSSRGFVVSALVDTDPGLIGSEVAGIRVDAPKALPELVKALGLEIAVITTPADAAQRACDEAVQAGVTAILNFAPRTLEVPPSVILRDVDLSVELHVLSFHQSHRHEAGRRGGSQQPGTVVPSDADRELGGLAQGSRQERQ